MKTKLFMNGLLIGIVILGLANAEQKILYYRNPMNPKITSPTPLKDAMGMDYVPVYAEAVTKQPGVHISLDKQKLLGIETTVVRPRTLTYELKAAGTVAYDTDLYAAQQEYLAAKQSAAADLVQAAEQRLRLAGMSQTEIQELITSGKPEQNVYLPDDTAWVYLAVYEQDAGLITENQTVTIETPVAPGKIFYGKIGGISPILDPETRSVKVRVAVANKARLLKPQLFVNATIKIPFGTKLAIPVSAVIDTGTRKVVYIAIDKDRFVQKEIKTGQQVGDYYAVVSGLRSGDSVVKSGSFFVDSESTLKE